MITSETSGVWELDDIYNKVNAGYLSYVGADPGLYLAGNGSVGRLGLNDNISRSSPVQLPGTQWTRLLISSGETFGIKSNGTLWAWGTGNLGGLGLNSTIDFSSPTQLPGTQWSAISGAYSIAATKTDGTLWTWGWNSYGDLGVNDTVNYSSPRQVPGTQWTVTDCFSGSQQNAARKTDGTLWVWGRNYASSLGQNQPANAPFAYSSPRQIPGTQWNSAHIATVGLATKTDGTLWSWGYNFAGSLGHNDQIYRSSPTQVPGTQWQKVSDFVNTSSIFLKTDGTLWAWGTNNAGQQGVNDRVRRSSPTQVPGTQWSNLIGGDATRFAKKTDGTLWVWGNNGAGDLGLNNRVDRSSPTQIPGFGWSLTNISGDSFVSFIT